MSQWCILFGSLLFALSCNDSKYPEIPLPEAIAKIQSGKIDRVEAIGESTLLITEKNTLQVFQSDINGQFDRMEAIASNAHVDGTIGAYDFQPMPKRSFSTAMFLLVGGLGFGLLIVLRYLLRRNQ